MAQRESIAVFELGEGRYTTHLGARRAFVSAYGVPLHSEAEVRLQIAKDDHVWSEPPTDTKRPPAQTTLALGGEKET